MDDSQTALIPGQHVWVEAEISEASDRWRLHLLAPDGRPWPNDAWDPAQLRWRPMPNETLADIIADLDSYCATAYGAGALAQRLRNALVPAPEPTQPADCSTCSGSGLVHCAAHIAGDGCVDMEHACPDCSTTRPADAPGRVGVAHNPWYPVACDHGYDHCPTCDAGLPVPPLEETVVAPEPRYLGVTANLSVEALVAIRNVVIEAGEARRGMISELQERVATLATDNAHLQCLRVELAAPGFTPERSDPPESIDRWILRQIDKAGTLNGELDTAIAERDEAWRKQEILKRQLRHSRDTLDKIIEVITKADAKPLAAQTPGDSE